MYRLIQDDDCHWYVILVSEEDLFNKWLDAAPYFENYNGKDFNKCRINGPHTIMFKEFIER